MGLSTPSGADGIHPTRALVVPRSFELREDPQWESRRLLIERLSSRFGVGGIEAVLERLNRGARSGSGSVRLFRDSEKRKKASFRYSGAFTWDAEDSRSTAWYPQGITGSGDAWATGTIGGRRVLLVSWYARKNAHKGARVTLLDVTDPRNIRYRHLLLVQPVERGGRVDFVPVPIHAGGIALYRNFLYVADTLSGIRVFDTDAIFSTAGDPGRSKVGVVRGQAYAFNYRYAIPMVGHYFQPSRQNMRFSFVSLDRTSVPHSLWVGEYSEATMEGFGANFSLEPTSGRLEKSAGSVSTSRSVLRFNRERTQGFVAVHRSYVLSHTYSNDPYRLHVQTPGGYASLKAPYGLEDLHYDPTVDRLWMLTEHPKSRAVFYYTAPDELSSARGGSSASQ